VRSTENALLKEGNKSDKIDARKLADLLRGGYLCSVYHGENSLRTLKELARSYLTISKDLSPCDESGQDSVSKLGRLVPNGQFACKRLSCVSNSSSETHTEEDEGFHSVV
jgi:hypothetical protein